MNRILITGATGNVGKEVIGSLLKIGQSHSIVAGVQDVEESKMYFTDMDVQLQHFDFEDSATFRPAFDNCDILFLLRPPQISDVKRYFVPLIEAAKQTRIKHIVFLSVQGAENSKFIPHHKIERLIVESKIPYTFLRPAYFMQNFTTTLHADLTEKKLIYLPAGKAKFTVIDVADIGHVAASVLLTPHEHQNKAYALTNNEKLTFAEMVQKISIALGTTIQYKSPNLLSFYRKKRKEHVAPMFIMVMIMLHYLPRFQKEPEITDCVKTLTGKEPASFDDFVKNNVDLLNVVLE